MAVSALGQINRSRQVQKTAGKTGTGLLGGWFRSQSIGPENQHGNGEQMKTYLNVPYHQKDAAKRLGARWDGVAGRWYVDNAENIAAFMQWMPAHLRLPANKEPVKFMSDREKREIEKAIRTERAAQTRRSRKPKRQAGLAKVGR
jgi:hypothetical protein